MAGRSVGGPLRWRTAPLAASPLDLVLRIEREATLNRVMRSLGDWKPKDYAVVGNLYCVCLTKILRRPKNLTISVGCLV